MNFIADESVDQPIVDYLRKNNYNVTAIVEMDPVGKITGFLNP